MKKITQILIITFATISLSSCSIAPGVPGLKTSSSKKSKPPKEGIDYKLEIINADTILKQRPFDYASYVRNKKEKVSLYNLQSSSSNNIYLGKTSLKQNFTKEGSIPNKSHLVTPQDQHNQNVATLDKKIEAKEMRFEGVTAADKKSNYQYYIGKGDVLAITVWDHPKMSSPDEKGAVGHVVGSDGRFYFPYAGKTNALGQTVNKVQKELRTKLGSFITKPQVSVSIANFRSQKIYTSGALVKPSTLIIDDTPTTVRDAISKSGGLRPNQYTGYATLARNGKNISIDLNRMLKYNDNRQNFILKNGDRLNIVERTELAEFNRRLNLDVRKENTLSSVRLRNEIKSLKTLNPVKLQFELEKEKSIARLKKELERELRSEQAKVFVMGEVLKPGSVKYQVEDGMTLAEAINDAGSFKEDSVNPKGVFVIRKENGNDKIPTVYQLPIASVQSVFLAEQFDVRPRDVVYVTATPSIRWNRVLAQLLPSLAILNTFRNFN